jgi:hypothetical protein
MGMTLGLTLTETHMLRVFENRVLRRIFGPKKVEVTGEWRRLHNEELYDPYSSPNINRVMESRVMRMGWACGTYGKQERCIKGFGGRPEEADHLEDRGVDGRIILK